MRYQHCTPDDNKGIRFKGDLQSAFVLFYRRQIETVYWPYILIRPRKFDCERLSYFKTHRVGRKLHMQWSKACDWLNSVEGVTNCDLWHKVDDVQKLIPKPAECPGWSR
eukprot:gnl/TRDRNA2_/TRDRNA2_157897_c2_seq1.p1 gnl/TRDRNA2_/TRDRNA2_157897_c2~~gnl/TRDRNA2_/TRDRNA2_157897_c2_seq1.p1  ORF type:complete len:109 (+),score=4.49 gnl/TRDRNA2_/TRDRNA2_157897_c2_seq1:45-371(+)